MVHRGRYSSSSEEGAERFIAARHKEEKKPSRNRGRGKNETKEGAEATEERTKEEEEQGQGILGDANNRRTSRRKFAP